MKVTLLTLFTIILSAQLYAQNIEVSGQVNSGLCRYAGNGTASTSFINAAGTPDAYTNNPYGNKNGFSYGGGIQAQYVSKGGFIAGVQGGYEILRAKTTITEVYPYGLTAFPGSPNSSPATASGATFLQNADIDLNPYIGYRLNVKKTKIDIMPGIDFGFNISSYDKGSATATGGGTYTVDRNMYKAPTDVRLRLGIAAWYNKFGITVSYAYGLVNYRSNLDEAAGPGYTFAMDAHTELLRFGVTYRVF